MKGRNKLTSLIIVVVMLFCGIGLLGCEFNDYVRITDVKYHAVLGDEGRVTVKEQLTFDIHAASESNPFWELWRDLPEEWENNERVVSFNVLSVKQIMVDGKTNYLELGRATKLYWDDEDYVANNHNRDLSVPGLGPNRWYHSEGRYDDYKNFECLMIYVDGIYRQTITYEIEYEIFGAAVKYLDCAELYLPMYGGETIEYLNSFSAQILIPDNLMPSSYHVWTYGTVSHEIPFEHSTTTNAGFNTFSFSLQKNDLKFKPYNRYIEFSLLSYGAGFDKLTPSVLVRTVNQNVYEEAMRLQGDYEGLPQKYFFIKLLLLLASLGLSFLIIWYIFVVDKKYRKKYKFKKPSVEYDFYREIPSALDVNFAGAFVFCKHKFSNDVKGVYAAAMLGLVRKKYIELLRINESKDWNLENVKVSICGFKPTNINPQPIDVFEQSISAQSQMEECRQSQNTTPLSQIESDYLNLIRRHCRTGEIPLNDLQQKIAEDYDYTDRFVKGVKGSVLRIGHSLGYFAEYDYKRIKKQAMSMNALRVFLAFLCFAFNFITYQYRIDLIFGGLFVLGGAFIAAAVLSFIKSKTYVLLTQLGEDEYSKWRGLYCFLNSETLINERTVPELAVWEDYLMYATAFGISKKVIKALKVRFPEININNNTIVRHPFLASYSFSRVYTRSARGATRRASITRATGGGGGYGSGGRGGGGGGGGH